MELNLDEVEDKVPKDELVCKKEFEDCRCGELEDRSKKAEARCCNLELEIQKRKSEYEALEDKFKALGVEKLEIKDELKVLKRRNDELNERTCNGKVEKKISCGTEKKMEGVVDLTEENEEEDAVVQLMMENSALECKKKQAESEVEVWKEKFRKLQSMVVQLEECSVFKDGERPLNENMKEELGSTNEDFPIVSARKETSEAINATCDSTSKGIGHLQTAASPYNVTPYKHSSSFEGEKRGASFKSEVAYGRRVSKHLAFEEERSPSRKIAPSTPGGVRPASPTVIEIRDSDDESNAAHTRIPSPDNQEDEKVCILTDHALEESVASDKEMISGDSSNRRNCEQTYKENVSECQDNALFLSTPKRKRAFNIVTSDTESDDDNVPIGIVKRLHMQEILPQRLRSELKSCQVTAPPPGYDNVTGKPPRRRLVSLRQCERNGRAEKCFSSEPSETKHQGIPPMEDVQDDESEEDESYSEGESLSGFIVDNSDVSSGDYAFSVSQDESDADVDFDEILSRLHRNKNHKSKWEFEADMLAAFGKDPELCMKAVCALYRQQTADEKLSKEALHQNQRGFSKFDALRGTNLGEFLTDGDPQGDLKKSVKELQDYDPQAVELCRTLATRYSKQLFEIYKKEEDPFFIRS